MENNEIKYIAILVALLTFALVVYLIFFTIIASMLRQYIDMELYRILGDFGIAFFSAVIAGVFGYLAGRKSSKK